MEVPPTTEDFVGQGLIRIQRRQVLKDVLRRYTVLIDGERVGKLSPFRTGSYPVAPGRHTVQLRIAGTGKSQSDDISVEVARGETRLMRTAPSSLKGMLYLPLAIFNPRKYAPRPWIRLETKA